ncbi:hypothetical protein ACU4GD_12085 [Cupriavidus basilensis]
MALPKFAIKQHWHPRFHHDPAIIWLRELVKRTFEHYPKVFVGEDEPPASPPPPVKRSRRVAKEK